MKLVSALYFIFKFSSTDTVKTGNIFLFYSLKIYLKFLDTLKGCLDIKEH